MGCAFKVTALRWLVLDQQLEIQKMCSLALEKLFKKIKDKIFYGIND